MVVVCTIYFIITFPYVKGTEDLALKCHAELNKAIVDAGSLQHSSTTGSIWSQNIAVTPWITGSLNSLPKHLDHIKTRRYTVAAPPSPHAPPSCTIRRASDSEIRGKTHRNEGRVPTRDDLDTPRWLPHRPHGS